MSTNKIELKESKTEEVISKEDLNPSSLEFLEEFCPDSDYKFLEKFNLIFHDIAGLKMTAYDETTNIEQTMLCLLRISELEPFNLTIQLPIILYLQDKQHFTNAYYHSLYSIQNTNFTSNELIDTETQTKIRLLYECHIENLYHLNKYAQVTTITQSFLDTYSQIVSSRMFHMSFFANVKLKQWSQALIDITKSISINPNNATLFNHRCFVHCEMNNFDKALEDANHCIRIEPKHQIGLNNRGSVYNDLKKYDLAIIDLDLAIKVSEGKNANAYRHRAYSFYKLGKYDMAIRDINQALIINNEYKDAKELKKILWNEHLKCINIGIEIYCEKNKILFLTPLPQLITDYTVGTVSKSFLSSE
eukprot:132607_1